MNDKNDQTDQGTQPPNASARKLPNGRHRTEWLRKRTCENCGKTYCMNDHLHGNAARVVDALVAGGNAYVGVEARHCPDCYHRLVNRSFGDSGVRVMDFYGKIKWWQFWYWPSRWRNRKREQLLDKIRREL